MAINILRPLRYVNRTFKCYLIMISWHLVQTMKMSPFTVSLVTIMLTLVEHSLSKSATEVSNHSITSFRLHLQAYCKGRIAHKPLWWNNKYVI